MPAILDNLSFTRLIISIVTVSTCTMLLGLLERSLLPLGRSHLPRFNTARLFYQKRSLPQIRAARAAFSRCYSSMKTPTQLGWTSFDCDSMSAVPLPQNSPSPQVIKPHTFEGGSLSWQPIQSDPGQAGFGRGRLLRIVSWNIDFMTIGRGRRAEAAMNHLKDRFGMSPLPLVIMLQEVHSQSLTSLLAHPWVRENFALSNIEAPERYFTIMMVSKNLQSRKWFRMPLFSAMRRDALIVDIPISASGEKPGQLSQILRLCTTHLESLYEPEGSEKRPLQLAQISALLKAPPTPCTRIVAGLLGGDMNPMTPVDFASHRAKDVDLYDIWEETPPPPIPSLKPFQKDLTFGRARGNTWGYQSNKANCRKRMDKFFYTGSMDMVALNEVQDITGKVGRLGIGVKTRVEALETELKGWRVRKGKMINYTYIQHSDPLKESWLTECLPQDGIRTEIDAWVSDHFGIAIGVSVG